MLDQLIIFFEMLIIVIEAGHQERRSPVGGRPGHNLAQVWRMVHHPAVVVPDGHHRHRHHLHIIVIISSLGHHRHRRHHYRHKKHHHHYPPYPCYLIIFFIALHCQMLKEVHLVTFLPFCHKGKNLKEETPLVIWAFLRWLS